MTPTARVSSDDDGDDGDNDVVYDDDDDDIIQIYNACNNTRKNLKASPVNFEFSNYTLNLVFCNYTPNHILYCSP